MSSALAIAGVTAVLKDLLNDGFINHNISGVLGSTVLVSALPPDRLVAANGTENTQLNLFLHQVTPNLGWRNECYPSRDGSGQNRLTNPPLALDLHYLVSAYGAEDLHAEILLGYAMQLFHETPVLNRRAITTALKPSPSVGTTLPPALRALADCDLENQLEQIKVTPEYLSTEEMSKLWSAVQSHYRPTAAYMVTVVLIESDHETRATLPVLTRGLIAEPSLLPPYPTIETVSALNRDPNATVGKIVTVTGHHLDGTDHVILLTNVRFQIVQEVSVEGTPTSVALQFIMPDLPVGIYQVEVRVIRPAEVNPRMSNTIPVTMGPDISTGLSTRVTRDGNGRATIVLTVLPAIRPEQKVSLLLGTKAVFAEPITTTTNNLTFVMEDAPVGIHLVRLRVDGIESPLINRMLEPPEFYDHRIEII